MAALRLGDIAPDFTQESTAGTISFHQWLGDINETQNTKVEFPILADPDRKVADLYDTIHPNANDTLTDPEVLKQKFPKGYKVVKPYLRITPQPNK